MRDLVADWNLIADLAFADLVLWVPTWNSGGYVAVAHQRPDTARTRFHDDIVGTFVARGRRPLLDRAVVSARAQRAAAGSLDQRVYPLPDRGTVVALLGYYAGADAGDSGRLASAYRQSADDLLAMVLSGDFPLAARHPDGPLRAGGGLLRLDADGVVTFASPNAVSAFRRLGAAVDLQHVALGPLASRLHAAPDGTDPDVRRVASGQGAGRVELEHAGAALELEALPLTPQGGALVLVRDVTELRNRERALLSSEATLREVHHRIKNNLQMVAALLRLQSRRVEGAEAQTALQSAGTRVSAIAGVHEVLAASPGSDVDFDDVGARILAMVGELAPEARLSWEGSVGTWPAASATPMAMCLAELVGNAVEHAGPRAGVGVLARVRDEVATIRIDDDGPGLPPDFSPESSGRLGLSIVRTLVAENGGSVQWANRAGGGASVTLEFRKTLPVQGLSSVR